MRMRGRSRRPSELRCSSFGELCADDVCTAVKQPSRRILTRVEAKPRWPPSTRRTKSCPILVSNTSTFLIALLLTSFYLELRARFDNGDDPNDPTSGHGGHPGHGYPFQHQGGGMPFQNMFFQQGGRGGQQFGGGQQFHFQWS